MNNIQNSNPFSAWMVGRTSIFLLFHQYINNGKVKPAITTTSRVFLLSFLPFTLFSFIVERRGRPFHASPPSNTPPHSSSLTFVHSLLPRLCLRLLRGGPLVRRHAGWGGRGGNTCFLEANYTVPFHLSFHLCPPVPEEEERFEWEFVSIWS